MIPLTADMVSAMFGTTAGGTGTSGTGTSGTGTPTTALAALRAAQAAGAEAKGVALEQRDPVSITALGHFKSALAGAKDATAALRDPRVLAVLLPALGLADQMAYPGLVQKALLADPADPKGLLASLDARFKTAATTLGLKAKGLAGLRDPAIQTKLTDGYLRYQYQSGLDTANPGISDALYFVQNAGTAKDAYALLGNAVMRRVVTGALGLPKQMAVQSVETQARAITTRLKLADLQDPKKVQQIAQRYVMAAAPTDGTTGSPLLSLFA